MIALSVLLPLTAALLTFVFQRQRSPLIGSLFAFGTLATTAEIAWRVYRTGSFTYPIGGWTAPLGIELFADPLSAFMLLLTAGVGSAISLYALGYLEHPPGATWHESDGFWPLWFLLWSALNALYLSADLFNLYVTLEILTLAAVALVTLSGETKSLMAAMRYLLMGLPASLFYLFGVALLYAEHGTLALYGFGVLTDSRLNLVALGLMTLGLGIKSALFPFHIWLPPAHANAPAPVSALLSGLVVKGSFYIILRLFLELAPPAFRDYGGLLLGGLGAVAVLYGSLLAIGQARLKLLIAYSTVAQLGYLFLLFPFLQHPAAVAGGLYQVLAHALAKSALFMVAGILVHARETDKLADLAGAARKLPLAMLAFALGAYSLMGLPPSGGYLAKELLETAITASGQGLWTLPLYVGGFLAAVYLALVLRVSLKRADPEATWHPIPLWQQAIPLMLALGACFLEGFISEPLTLLGGHE